MAKNEVLNRARRSPSGFWSPESAAKEILVLSKWLAQDSGCRPELLCSAAIQGINEAERIVKTASWICRETLRLVKEGFENWAKAGSYAAP